VEYVGHPDFRLNRTEEELFGPEADEVRVAQWRHLPVVLAEDPSQPKARVRLTCRQEILLFKRYNYARYRLAILASVQRRDFDAHRVGRMLFWYRRLLACRGMLVDTNGALVVAMVKRTRTDSVEFGELVSEGNMVLLRAIDKFDVSRGFKFSTYACRAILRALGRLASKAAIHRRHFPTAFEPGMEPSDEPDRRRRYERDSAIEELQRMLAHNGADLTDVERTVVGARFGVYGYEQTHTLEQVSRLVSLSKERVRQLQQAALAKLRAALLSAVA